MTHFNRNVNRNQVGLDSPARQSITQGSSPTIQRAVVMDVILKPDELSEEYKDSIRGIVNNPEFIDIIPVNAVIARMIKAGQGLFTAQDTILFPFFSSHILLPIQPGEQVYVIYEDYVNQGNKLGYWLTRPHSPQTIEDVNYTHFDRMFDPRNNPINYTTQNNADINFCPKPGFENGGNTDETQTISPGTRVSGSGINPYDLFFKNSQAGRITTPEPVPRWNKRPQELVLQGSNNTLIMLGEDRFGHVSGAVSPGINNIDRTDIKGQAGSIDLVAGRGRMIPRPNGVPENDPVGTSKPIVGPESNQQPEGTAPRIIENTRGNFETDKAPFRQKSSSASRVKDNPKEGDPDFSKDAARILVSMQTEGDLNFGIDTFTYPENSLKPEQPQVSTGNLQNVSGSFNRSYVIQKGDHLRLIARNDNDLGVDGSILLIREGDKDAPKVDLKHGSETGAGTQDKELDYIYLTKDGIQIQAEKIYFGPATQEQEPYVLWSKYADTVRDLQEQIALVNQKNGNQILNLQAALQILFNAVAAALASGNVCPPGSPNPGVSAAAALIPQLWSNTNGINSQLNSDASGLLNKQTQNMQNNVSPDKHSHIIFGV